MAEAPLPPGQTGLPILGETLSIGFEFAPMFLQVFLIELFRSYSVAIARPQNLDLDWSRVPPEPRDGLRASVRRR